MGGALTWRLAIRYLRGKRTGNAVPILSRVSMVAITVCSAAMIIVFSAFNGLENLVKEQYKAFYSDLKVSAARGKFFRIDDAKLKQIKGMSGVRDLSPVIEDNVFVRNDVLQKVVTLKGITNNYFNVTDVRRYILQGHDSVSIDRLPTAIAGFRIVNELGIDVGTQSTLTLYYPNPEAKILGLNPVSDYQSLTVHPSGAFNVSVDFDDKYLLVPLSSAQELLHRTGYCSAIEISASPDAIPHIKHQLQQLFGVQFKVESRFEQNKTMYMVMNGEKWAIYAILVLVLFIASFNMVGALTMLVLAKQRDIAILHAMGASNPMIRRIFFLEGILWSLVGAFTGILIGYAACMAQKTFGLVKLSSSFIIDAYPVRTEIMDILYVILIIVVVGALAAWYPAFRSTQTEDPSLKST